jgi:enoyl-CoA hydratase/carnithine racemase
VKNFNIGGSSGGTIDMSNFLNGLSGFAYLHSRLESFELPIIAVCHGATRGGGMLFRALADVVIATDDASFGFPEIRRGFLPGLVSVSSKQKLGDWECMRLMMTRDTFDSFKGKEMKFVDFVHSGRREEGIVQALAWASTIAESVTMWRQANKFFRLQCDPSSIFTDEGLMNLHVFDSQSVAVSWLGSHIACLEIHNCLN